jgi:FAD/FMN-containing dehydrogenase
VTATGERLVCRPDNENALLFQMQHGAFGTLGVITKATFRLMPAKRFVQLTYEKHATLRDYLAAFERHAKEDGVDFIDGFIHAPDELVINLGRFVDEAPYTNRYDRLAVYYKSTRRRVADYLTTYQYLFRYDRGVTRVQPLLSSEQVLRLAEKLQWLLGRTKPSVTVDLFLPFSRVEAFMDWYQRTLGFFPLWCVPYRRVRDYEWLSPRFFDGLQDQLLLDIAIYGMKQPRGRNTYRELEEALNRFGGLKTLISHNYYPPEEFWRIWNRDNHERAKRVVDPANVFGDLYSKTCARGAT